jgi:hypothetical protein
MSLDSEGKPKQREVVILKLIAEGLSAAVKSIITEPKKPLPFALSAVFAAIFADIWYPYS